MAKNPRVDYQDVRQKTLHTAARMFLEQGYTATTVRGIAKEAGIQVSAMVRAMGSKENILLALVDYVLEGQFAAAQRFLQGKTDDPVYFYAAETTLQLYMVESDEAIRNLYGVAYSMPETSSLITHKITNKLQQIFGAYLPELEVQDFWELEIASGGLIRAYMTVPCTEAFTMERKVRRFTECSLRLYQVPEEKIQQTIAFVSQFDYPAIAQRTIEQILRELESREHFD